MNLKPRHKVDPSFNMSSMTDVIFLLLIFFIMTSSSVTPTGKKVDLPSGEKTVTKQSISVTITKDLEYQVNGKNVTFEKLLPALEEAYTNPSDNKLDNVVVVNGDQSVDYGEVMKVVALAAQLDNITVTLGTKQD